MLLYGQCCKRCFDFCLKYICKESLYITAIQGTSFYPSGKVSFVCLFCCIIQEQRKGDSHPWWFVSCMYDSWRIR